MKTTGNMLIPIAIAALTAETAVAMLMQQSGATFGRRGDVKDSHDKYANEDVPTAQPKRRSGRSPRRRGSRRRQRPRARSGAPPLHGADPAPAAAGASAYLTRSTCSNSSSTGVARPKIETETFTRPFSKSSSSTMPLKLAKGPSSTLIESPIS